MVARAHAAAPLVWLLNHIHYTRCDVKTRFYLMQLAFSEVFLTLALYEDAHAQSAGKVLLNFAVRRRGGRKDCRKLSNSCKELRWRFAEETKVTRSSVRSFSFRTTPTSFSVWWFSFWLDWCSRWDGLFKFLSSSTTELLSGGTDIMAKLDVDVLFSWRFAALATTC